MPPLPLPGHNKAFTLLEVMLAVMIFALVVTGMVTAIDRTGDSIGLGLQELRARAALETRLAEIRANPTGADSLAATPGQETGDPPLVIDQTIEPALLTARDGTPLEGLFRVRLSARWTTAAHTPDPLTLEEIVALTGYGTAESP